MSHFSQAGERVERGFRHWAGKTFGAADSDDLVKMLHAVLEAVGARIVTIARGQRMFPFSKLTVTLASPDADRRTLYQAAFAESGRFENDIREALEASGCQIPRGFSVEFVTRETGDRDDEEIHQGRAFLRFEK